jgi:hypothetical protein
MHKCTRCFKKKDTSKFGNDIRKKYGKKSRCKQCEKEVRAIYYNEYREEINAKINEYKKKNPEKTKSTLLKHWYGIDINQYNELLVNQNNKCAICRTDKPARFGRISKSFHVDHDHKTKKVRGLLCSSCNQGLGYFKDSTTLLQRAMEYLLAQA